MNKSWKGTALFLLAVLFTISMAERVGAEQRHVSSTADDLNGVSLRTAIKEASDGDTIVFQIPTTDPGYNSVTSTYTITLGDELLISKDLTIDAIGSKIVITRGSAAGTPKFHIFHITVGTVTIANLTITNGFGSPLDPGGGGIHNEGNLTVRNCAITGNSDSQNGSGAGIYTTAKATLAVINSTIHGNTISSGEGAGIGTEQYSQVEVTGCTITNNTIPGPANAAGIISRGVTTIRNTIITGNTVSNGAGSQVAYDVEGTFVSGGFNFIGDADFSSGLGSAGSHDQTGTSSAPIDPKLGPLQDNGGFTPTRLPLAGSPVLDQGDSGGITTDQRGFARVTDQPNVSSVGDGADIGAVEKGVPQNGPTYTVTTTAERNSGSCLTDDCSLIEALNAANLFSDANVINFAPSVTGAIGTAILTPSGLAVTNPVTINGPGARLLTITGRTSARVFRVTSPGVTIAGLSIVNGKVTDDNGGAISNTGGLTLKECRVNNSVAASNGGGGGVQNASGATLTLLRCTFTNNSAGQIGGAVRNVGVMTATNCTFAGNSAIQGGGIYSDFNNNNSKATLLNCTVTHCTATDASTAAGNGGGGLYFVGNNGQYDVGNSIIAGNTAAVNPDLRGNFTTDGHNFIGLVGNTTGFADGTKGDQVGTSGTGKDPQFLNAAVPYDFGGPTDTIGLDAGSLAVDAGDDALAPATDQRGYSRQDKADIGAVEISGLPPLPIVTTIAATNIGTTSAVLNATFNPRADSASFRFVGDFATLGLQFEGASSATLPVSERVTGLSPNTQYHFHAVVVSAGGTAQGVEQTFTTLPSASATPTPTPTTLANISTRLPVQTGDNALIGGFIIAGTQPKKVIIRAIGPSLPFPGVLADPTLELYQGNTLLESNDNWVDSPNKQAIIDSTIPPSNNLEAAIVRTLPANGTGYTAIVRGAKNGTGIGVVEAYDLDRSVDSKLANISTRGFVQTGDNVLIAGTIILGQAPQKVIIRAIGPSLPLAGRLGDPTLQLVNGSGTVLEENDNWVDSPNKQAIIDSTIPPSNNLESAIVRTLPANGAQYTAIVRGVNNTTGIAVVEIYALH